MEPDPLTLLDSLYSAVVADVLDAMGHRQQVLGSAIQALTPASRVCGRVFTAHAVPVDEPAPNPYELEMEAIDAMAAGDVLVVDAGYCADAALWGELLSTACLAKDVRGVVMSTCTRDLWALNELGFPVFGIGRSPADSAGRLQIDAIRHTIVIDGVVIHTGDWILGDADGVVVIPQTVAPEVVRRAHAKVTGESTVREELRAGVPVSEVFRKHGIL